MSNVPNKTAAGRARLRAKIQHGVHVKPGQMRLREFQRRRRG